MGTSYGNTVTTQSTCDYTVHPRAMKRPCPIGTPTPESTFYNTGKTNKHVSTARFTLRGRIQLVPFAQGYLAYKKTPAPLGPP